MAGQAILPRSDLDPTGVDPLERKAMDEYARRMRQVNKAYRDELDAIPATLAVNERYTFDLDQGFIRSIFNSLSAAVDRILVAGGQQNPWFYEMFIKVAAVRGTAQEFANLSNQSPVYAKARNSVADIVASEPYVRRAALVKARTFEGMKSLSEQVKSDMGRVLSEGIANGKNPRDIAKSLTEQTGINIKRSNRIARTEIPTALRRARWDESEEARINHGIEYRLLHMSALSPTTRVTHAERHGKLFTDEEVRDWYSEGANAINCKCSQISVVVDDDGKPLNSKILARAAERKRIMIERGNAPWAEDLKDD